MKTTTRHFVTFFYAGRVVADSQTEEIRHADPSAVVVPARSYAFRLHDIREITDDDGVVLRSDLLNRSKTFWPGGVLKTLDEVRREQGSRILVENMECNGWPSVVFSRFGSWPQPFDPATAEIIPLTESNR